MFNDPYRATGKPHKRVVDRIESHDLNVATSQFPTPELKAYYFAVVIEATACWPRVQAGTMKQERFHARTERMMNAIRFTIGRVKR
jgi:hypothetical protein